MEQGLEKFDLQSTVATVWNAIGAVTCHILFDGAIHGLIMAAIICTIGLALRTRQHRFGKPLIFAALRIALVCVLATIPGVLCLVITGKLPETGVYNVNSLGFIVFWSMVSVHLCAEEMNFQWWYLGPPPQELGFQGKLPEQPDSDQAMQEPSNTVDATEKGGQSTETKESPRERVGEPR